MPPATLHPLALPLLPSGEVSHADPVVPPYSPIYPKHIMQGCCVWGFRDTQSKN